MNRPRETRSAQLDLRLVQAAEKQADQAERIAQGLTEAVLVLRDAGPALAQALAGLGPVVDRMARAMSQAVEAMAKPAVDTPSNGG